VTFGHPSAGPIGYSDRMLAAWGFLEWFFAGVLGLLLVVVGAFFLYLIAALFVNPARRGAR
jgi:hypothetical protein